MRWLLVALALGGCGYKVRLTSSPLAASVALPDGSTVVTPAEVQFRYRPFGRQKIEVSAPGYRSVSFDLRRKEIRLSRYVTDALFRPETYVGKPRGYISVVLIPTHGPVGTWQADDVP